MTKCMSHSAALEITQLKYEHHVQICSLSVIISLLQSAGCGGRYHLSSFRTGWCSQVSQGPMDSCSALKYPLFSLAHTTGPSTRVLVCVNSIVLQQWIVLRFQVRPKDRMDWTLKDFNVSQLPQCQTNEHHQPLFAPVDPRGCMLQCLYKNGDKNHRDKDGWLDISIMDCYQICCWEEQVSSSLFLILIHQFCVNCPPASPPAPVFISPHACSTVESLAYRVLPV